MDRSVLLFPVIINNNGYSCFHRTSFRIIGHILYLYLIVRPGKTLLQADIEDSIYISLAEKDAYLTSKVTPEI